MNPVKQRSSVLLYIATEGCRYVLQSFKDCIKRLLGRKLNRDERLVFFRQYVLHLLRIRPIEGITSAVDSDFPGAGYQALMSMNAQCFARAAGLLYLHTPFVTISHANRPMREWLAVWELLFNLGAGELSYDAAKNNAANYCSVQAELDFCFGRGCIQGQLARNFRAMIPEFRKKYYSNKSPRYTNCLTVAVHIRRGDVSANTHCQLFTSNDYVRQTVADVKRLLDSRDEPYNLRIYSQGDRADFENLSSLDAEFFLDADPIWTMQELIEADILIMARGSFSYYAGIVSDGIKIFEPRTIPAEEVRYFPSFDWRIFSEADDWLPCRPDGSIDPAAFERRLSLLLRAKKKIAAGA